MTIRHLLFIIILLFISPLTKAQKGKEFVTQTFRSGTIINAQTTETPGKNSFELNVLHRFGMADIHDQFLNNFLGMDLSSNIRIHFDVAITPYFCLGIGRTKNEKHYDFTGKYRILKQTKDGQMPFTVALFSGASLMSDEISISEHHFQSDSITPFRYKYSYRLAYWSQVLIARKVSDKLSLQFAPLLVHQNLVAPGETNQIIVYSFQGRYKTALFSSLIMEYAFFHNKPAGFVNPFSVGYEIGTASHVFQITISSSKDLLYENLYTDPGENILDGKFFIGFNLVRRFYYKKN